MKQKLPKRTKTVQLKDEHYDALVELAEREDMKLRQTLDSLLETAFAVRRIPLRGEAKP